jgi:hypothetical protein
MTGREERIVPGSVALEDVLAVQDLLGRYCWFIDEGRGPEWAALYTDDGVFEGTRREPVIGRAALAEVPIQNWERMQGRMRHQIGNLYIEVRNGPNELIARFYNQLSLWNGEGGKLLMLALSTATLVREGPGASWRIRRNCVEVLK